MPTTRVRVVLFILYQYNGVLSVLVVESCPSVVACGQGGGVAPTWAEVREALHEWDLIIHTLYMPYYPCLLT